MAADIDKSLWLDLKRWRRTSEEFVNLAGVATALLGASEAVECAEAVTLSELAFEVTADVDVTIVVELATDVDAVAVAA
ncbi:MAG: hypothetical protein ACLTZN_03210 [Streptococcus sp.]